MPETVMPSNCTAPRSLASVRLRPRLAAAVAIALCAVAPLGTAAAGTGDEFVARLNKEFSDIALELNAAGWTQATLSLIHI